MSVANWRVPGALNTPGEQTGVITSTVGRCEYDRTTVCVIIHQIKERSLPLTKSPFLPKLAGLNSAASMNLGLYNALPL